MTMPYSAATAAQAAHLGGSTHFTAVTSLICFLARAWCTAGVVDVFQDLVKEPRICWALVNTLYRAAVLAGSGGYGLAFTHIQK